MSKQKFRGRGTHANPSNRFERHQYEHDDETYIDIKGVNDTTTQYVSVYPKTIVNKVTSPDVGMDYSLNPYQGCEHGCTYCYARPTHEYWGYGPGLDFERVIMVKKNAPELLAKAFEQKNWSVKPVILSGNTDCYQPCEKKFELTRQLLSVFETYQHPVGIITKNVLLKRDFDIIEQLAAKQLIAVNLSITTLNEDLRRKLEPRTATSARKLQLVEELAQIGVPVNVMACPIIPALNDHEIIPIAQAAAEHGATSFHSHVVRLMGPNEALFDNWLTHHFPDRKNKVLNQLKEIHSGKTGSSNFGDRMKGTGNYALNLMRQRQIAQMKYFPKKRSFKLRTDLFRRPPKHGQLTLFDD